MSGDEDHGLSSREVEARREQWGLNRLADSSDGRSIASILVAQFQSLLVGLLIVASLISFVTGDLLEGCAIVVVILLNALIGFLTEWKAERALVALKRQTVPVANVLRDGVVSEIGAEELVPGDLVLLAAGARVPADGRLLAAHRLQIDEATLTGESVPVVKAAKPCESPDTPLAERTSMAYLSTAILNGRGRMIVTATGANTVIGQIGTLLASTIEQVTPLERKLAELGRVLIVIVLAICGVIVLSGWFYGNDLLEMVKVGISLAIAAVPEGLPAVVAMTLAIGMQRMAQRRALVRRLPAVETLGSVTVICTDKTGTLTRNEMTATALWVGPRRLDVSGAGYSANGQFLDKGQPVEIHQDMHLALCIGALCNDTRIDRPDLEKDDRAQVVGDPTEAALLVLAMKAGISLVALARDYPRIAEIPFDSEAQRMVTVHRSPEGKIYSYVKGSPRVLLESSGFWLSPEGLSPLNEEVRRQWIERNNALARDALRVLALAYREMPANHIEADLTRDLVFVGLVGMIDPLRDEASEAIETCHKAGIRVMMLTGDQVLTATEIARQLKLGTENPGEPQPALHARDLDALDEDGFQHAVKSTSVFARVTPRHKLQIIQALQKQGHIVSMTGDGVNDAPALKTADIGVAMGIQGTEVAKETAAMIITDDNFSTIVRAVEQGRIIYSNIIKFIHYLFSCNLSEITVVFVMILGGWPRTLTPLQILWMNLITDVFPALALALEPSAPDTMTRPPRDPRRPLVDARFLRMVGWQGVVLASVSLLAFAVGLRWYGADPDGLSHAITLTFMTLSISQLVHVFNCRSRTRLSFSRGMFANRWLWAAFLICIALKIAAVTAPPLRLLLDTVWMNVADWLLVLGCSLVPVPIIDAVKAVTARQRRV